MFPRCLSLLLVLGLAFANRSRANGILSLAPESPILLGMGIDLVTGELKQPCIEWEDVEEVSQGQGTTFRYELVEDSRSMKKALSVEATAAYKNPLAHVSAKASFAKQVNANSYSLYILAMVDVRAPTQTLTRVKLKEEVKELLRSPLGIDRFRKVCGDEYIASLNRAGSFMGVIEVKTRDNQSKRKIKAQISGKMQGKSGSVALSSAVQSASQNHQVRSFQYVTGQARTALAVSPDEMVKNAELFPTRITSESALPYQASTFSYDSLLGWAGGSQVDSENQRLVVRELGKRRDRFQEKLADLDYILENPMQFQGADPQRLEAMRSIIYRNLEVLHQAAQRCHKDLSHCALPEGLANEDLYQGKRVPLPERAASLCYQEKRDPGCGAETYKTRRDPLCGVSRFKEKRDSVCGVEIYKSKRSAACGVERYKEKQHADCGTKYGSTKICNPCLACPKGYKKTASKLMKLTCRKVVKRTCRLPKFGVELWRECRDVSHGVERFRPCRQEAFGVEEYQECSREEFGAASYKSCAKPEFGLRECSDSEDDQRN